MAFQYPVIRHQIDKEILIVNQYPFLSAFKTETLPQFQDKLLNMTDQ